MNKQRYEEICKRAKIDSGITNINKKTYDANDLIEAHKKAEELDGIIRRTLIPIGCPKEYAQWVSEHTNNIKR